MYEVGTSVLYSRMGVYKVEHIGVPPFQKEDGPCYYRLRGVFSTSGELIYIPVDTAPSMRPLISGGEAEDALERFPRMESPDFRPKKPADLSAHYQALLASCEPEDCLRLVKEVCCKQRDLTARGKRLGQIDVRYQKVAEKLVCEEFAAALHTTPDRIRERLYAAMECEAAS